MIFNEDTILLQFFQIYEDDEELLQAVLKYCNGNLNYHGEDDDAEPTGFTDQQELDAVRNTFSFYVSRYRVLLTPR